MIRSIHLTVGGMICPACQNKIEKKLRATKGVIRAAVSYADGTADIDYDDEKLNREKIETVIKDLNYQIVSSQSSTEKGLLNTICRILIILGLYVMLQSTGILNHLVPGRLAESGMGYGMLFVLGLITSVHCVAMCGGINLSQCLPQRVPEVAQRKNKNSLVLPAAMYNLGRVCSYTVIGLLLGFFGFLLGKGAGLTMPGHLQGGLKLIAGALMVIMGLNMLDLFPALRKLSLRLPKNLLKLAGAGSETGRRPFIIGVLNGLMPCGPLQTMWVVALASGNPVSGAVSMLIFSLGTVPLMLGLGSAVSALGRKFADQVRTAGAILVAVMGLALLSQGGELRGWEMTGPMVLIAIMACATAALPYLPVRQKWIKTAVFAAVLGLSISGWVFFSRKPIQTETKLPYPEGIELQDGVQVVRSTLVPGTYPKIAVFAGIPVRWEINAPAGSINGCNARMLLTAYGIEHDFEYGENVIEFTPEEAGTVRYTCWMGMINGVIQIVENTENSENKV